MSRPGFTLLEVLIALIVLSGVLIPVLASLDQAHRLGQAGWERARVASSLESRAAWIRAESHRFGCSPPGPGTDSTVPGIVEWWTSRWSDSSIEAVLVARGSRSASPPESVVVRFSCR